MSVQSGDDTRGEFVVVRDVEPETPEPEEEPELKSYKLLKHDSDARVWLDLGEIEGDVRYGYDYGPTASIIGESWGDGDYMWWPTQGYRSLTFITVVSDTVYSEKRDDEVPS